jgi:NADH:ubiquinone oxidoreductase subunit 6 (subunit J)
MGTDLVVNVLFYAFAAAAVGGAVAVAASRNIVRSAFALLVVLFAAAALYALMKADFIAAAQVLIYVGGILVLIIFAVMLTHRITDVNISNESTPGPAAFCACLCLLFSLVVVILFAGHGRQDWWRQGPEEVTVKTARKDAGAAPADVELTLLQYQADARTGLASGGTAPEDHVVLVVKTRPPIPDATVEVELTPGEVERKGEAPPEWKAEPPLPGPYSGVVDRDGRARVDLRSLPEKAFRWRAKLSGPAGDLTSPVRPSDKAFDFRVYRGITEPAAFALMGPYLFAFEVVSVLLLAALVGAAFLARKEVKA